MTQASQLTPQFGINIDPKITSIAESLARAEIADRAGVDLIFIQDHPYIPNFLDTWTLLTFLAARTERVRLGTNVLNTPLRPPAMLAKAAASLDVLSGGRVDLGLGAGAAEDAVVAWGGRMGTPGERLRALRESVELIRGLWRGAGDSFSYEGETHQFGESVFGPTPAHEIPIWLGVLGPKALRMTGELADGVLITTSYVPVDDLARVNESIDEGASNAGRPPEAIRRGYNLMGVLELGGSGRVKPSRPGVIIGSAEVWIDEITRLYDDYRMDTFTFWPVAGNEREQVRAWAEEITPRLRERLTGHGEKHVT